MANIQDYLDSNPPQMAYRSIWDRLGFSTSEGGATLKAQALPAFGLSPSLDNLEIRLGRCEYGSCHNVARVQCSITVTDVDVLLFRQRRWTNTWRY